MSDSPSLDPRKHQILRAVVFEYVAQAEPVGSELLTQKYELGVRSATVRNELAEMSEMGYLDQPHTSAGRIPSDQGEVLQVLLSETTAMLSRLTRLMSAAVTVSDQHLRARSVMVTALGPESALLVLVLGNGHVQNRLLTVPAGLTLTELGQVNELLENWVREKTLNQIAKAKMPEATGRPALDKLVQTTLTILKQMARDLTKGKLTVDGEEYLFAQPEFQRDVRALETFLNVGTADDQILTVLQDRDSNNITIGAEHSSENWRPFSVIKQQFFIGNEEAGTIAIIGPTRLDYSSSIPLVDFTAQAISQTLTRLLKDR